VKDGKIDMGLVGSRAFDNLNVTSFEALQTPFLIDNDALAKAVATSDVAGQMLDNLSAAGFTGLTLWPEQLRHPISLVPGKTILSPQDFAGLTVRVVPSGVTFKLLEALGASPVSHEELEPSDQATEAGMRLGAGALSGNESAVGNVTFFPKFQVLFANQAAFKRLTEAQRAILRDAAQATQEKAIATYPSDADNAVAYCANGGTVVTASPEQVAAFQAAAKPVDNWLEQDSVNAQFIAAISQLKDSTQPSQAAQACVPPKAQ
jgi:TRAP-type C4-dicarboxylate transport system substrate-binding protein